MALPTTEYPRPLSGTIIGGSFDPTPPLLQPITTPSGVTAMTGYPQGVSAGPITPTQAAIMNAPRPPPDMGQPVQRPAPDAWQQYNAAVRANAIAAGQRATNMTPDEEKQALSRQMGLTQDTTQRGAIGARLGQVAQGIEEREAAGQEMPPGYNPQQWQAMSVRDRAKAIQVAQAEKGRNERFQTNVTAQDTRQARQLGVRVELAAADRELKAATTQAQVDASMERLLVTAGLNISQQQRAQLFAEKQLGARYAMMADIAREQGDERKELEMLRLGNDLQKIQSAGEVKQAIESGQPIPKAATSPRAMTAGAGQGQATATMTGGTATPAMPDVTGDGVPETQDQVNSALRLVQLQPKPNPSWTSEQIRRWTDATIIAREYEKLRKAQASKMVGTENI